MEISVINWSRNHHQSSTRESLRLFGFCVEGSLNILSPTKLGKTGSDGSHLLKATEIVTVSVERRLNSSGTSSQDSVRCSSMVKSQIY